MDVIDCRPSVIRITTVRGKVFDFLRSEKIAFMTEDGEWGWGQIKDYPDMAESGDYLVVGRRLRRIISVSIFNPAKNEKHV